MLFLFRFRVGEARARWVQAGGRENWIPTKSSRLCSDHFTADDYQMRRGPVLFFLSRNRVYSLLQTLFMDSFPNKVTSAHANWRKQNMKVKLAAHTLSSSVGNALDYLRASGYQGFQHTAPTGEFIQHVSVTKLIQTIRV